jgi:hypothetical protein
MEVKNGSVSTIATGFEKSPQKCSPKSPAVMLKFSTNANHLKVT